MEQKLAKKLLSFTHKYTENKFRGAERTRDKRGDLEKLAFEQHVQNIKDIFNDEYETFKNMVVFLRHKYNQGKNLPTWQQIIEYDIDMKNYIEYAREYQEAYSDGISRLLGRFPILPKTTCEYIQKDMLKDFEKNVMRPLQNGSFPLMDFSKEADANPAMIIKNHAFVIVLSEENKIVYRTIGGHDRTDYSSLNYFLGVWQDPSENTDLDTPRYDYFIPLTHFLTYYPYLVEATDYNGISWLKFFSAGIMNDMKTKVFTDAPFDETNQEF